MDDNPDIKYLDNDEVLIMELNHEKAKVNKVEIEKLELRKHMIKKDKMILELQSRLKDYELQGYVREQQDTKSQDAKRIAEHKEWTEWVQRKHELSDGWGFDPDSGEIKQG